MSDTVRLAVTTGKDPDCSLNVYTFNMQPVKNKFIASS